LLDAYSGALDPVSFGVRTALWHYFDPTVICWAVFLGAMAGILTNPREMLSGMSDAIAQGGGGCFGVFFMIFGGFGFGSVVLLGVLLLPGQVLYMVFGYIELNVPGEPDIEEALITRAIWICAGLTITTALVVLACKAVVSAVRDR
jgi:hypothetical protein